MNPELLALLAEKNAADVEAIITKIGIPTLLWRGRGLDFGLFQIPSPFEANREVAHQFGEIHEFLAHARTDISRLVAALELALLELTLPPVMTNHAKTVKEIQSILSGEK